jgi:hypothetical protein
MDAGLVLSLARVLAAKDVEGSLLGVRVHMLVSDLLRVEDMQVCLDVAVRYLLWKAAFEEFVFTCSSLICCA